ncbi:MAG: RNA polymerase sigma factor [Phycisphaerales bacterium]
MTQTPASDPRLSDWHARFARAVARWFISKTAGRRDVADDLSQRTWLALTRSLAAGRYDPSLAAPSTFVYAVMHNIWRQHAATLARTHAQGPAKGSQTRPGESDEGHGSDAAAGAELIEVVRELLTPAAGSAGLDAETAHTLRLIAEGVSDRELASRLGVAASTAHARKQAALERLRLAIQERTPQIAPSAPGPHTKNLRDVP